MNIVYFMRSINLARVLLVVKLGIEVSLLFEYRKKLKYYLITKTSHT